MDGLVINQLRKTYAGGTYTAIDCLSFTLARGEYLSLVGESGSGKSTLARMLIGLEKPTSGQILMDGEDTALWNYRTWRKHRRSIQGVFQDTSGTLNPMLSVYHNLEEALVNLTDLNRKQRQSRLFDLMALTGLDRALLRVPVRQLSGGEGRRLSLLRALSVIPDYLVLDEVVSGLDLISTDRVLHVLERYKQEHACACLFITHDMDSALRLSDRALEMCAGKLTRVGSKLPRKDGTHDS